MGEPIKMVDEVDPVVDQERATMVAEVFALQKALEEINVKIGSTKAQNSLLVKENEDLSLYIDSLMESISSMGSLITADKTTAKSVGGRARKSIKVNTHASELAKPHGRSKSVAIAPSSGQLPRRTPPLSPSRTMPTLLGPTLPLQSPVQPVEIPRLATPCAGAASPLRLPVTVPTGSAAVSQAASAEKSGANLAPPPPPPPPARDPVTGKFGVGGLPPPPPPPR